MYIYIYNLNAHGCLAGNALATRGVYGPEMVSGHDIN